MLIKSKLLFGLLLIMVFLLIGCTSSNINDELIKETANNSVRDHPQGYPINPKSDQYLPTDTGYPAPEITPYIMDFPDQIIIPTLTYDSGIVLGRMVTKNGMTNPYLAPAIYLGEVIEADNPEYPPLIGLDVEVNLIAIQDKEGNFIFEDVQPGKYGLIIWSPFSQTLIEDPDKEGYPLIIVVKKGELVDIGTIIVP